jgi:glycogen operon protein
VFARGVLDEEAFQALDAELGARCTQFQTVFRTWTPVASSVDLLLFDSPDAGSASRTIPLRREAKGAWSATVPGDLHGKGYLYRITSYGDARDTKDIHCVAATRDSGRSIVVDLDRVKPDGWDATPVPTIARPTDEVLYELHVRGFTAHPSSGVSGLRAGTYLGLIDKIPYLQDLGVTAVELLPVFQFDPQDAPPGLSNYWGYQPISFLVPHHGYAVSTDPLAVLDEFRTMVKAFHRAGLEVILDVVFNHTAEGGAEGPSFCFRGLSNRAYYLLDSDNGKDLDVTGCGNSFNANQAVVRRLIRHSLRYWVQHMHVDGFRFDLASVLARDEHGQPTPLPPILWDIDTDPVLAGTKLIAEAWDAAGLYQVGSFVGDNWQEWNGRFRDDVRHFLKGDAGRVRAVTQRLIGSPDIYGGDGREAEQSVNFITCHDGFTLADLVSYNNKHNAANGEDNRDGSDDNGSWNCGVEGDSQDPQVLALRQRQMRNCLAFLLLSTGTPMLSMASYTTWPTCCR